MWTLPLCRDSGMLISWATSPSGHGSGATQHSRSDPTPLRAHCSSFHSVSLDFTEPSSLQRKSPLNLPSDLIPPTRLCHHVLFPTLCAPGESTKSLSPTLAVSCDHPLLQPPSPPEGGFGRGRGGGRGQGRGHRAVHFPSLLPFPLPRGLPPTGPLPPRLSTTRILAQFVSMRRLFLTRLEGDRRLSIL